MMAWISPVLTVRLTPLRISSGSAPASETLTVTCRSRITRELIWSGLLKGDEHVVTVDLHGINRDGAGGRQTGRPPGGEVETGPVQPALDRALLDISLGQRYVLVGANVKDGVNIAVAADDRQRHSVDNHSNRPLVGHLGDGAGLDIVAHARLRS